MLNNLKDFLKSFIGDTMVDFKDRGGCVVLVDDCGEEYMFFDRENKDITNLFFMIEILIISYVKEGKAKGEVV